MTIQIEQEPEIQFTNSNLEQNKKAVLISLINYLNQDDIGSKNIQNWAINWTFNPFIQKIRSKELLTLNKINTKIQKYKLDSDFIYLFYCSFAFLFSFLTTFLFSLLVSIENSFITAMVFGLIALILFCIFINECFIESILSKIINNIQLTHIKNIAPLVEQANNITYFSSRNNPSSLLCLHNYNEAMWFLEHNTNFFNDFIKLNKYIQNIQNTGVSIVDLPKHHPVRVEIQQQYDNLLTSRCVIQQYSINHQIKKAFSLIQFDKYINGKASYNLAKLNNDGIQHLIQIGELLSKMSILESQYPSIKNVVSSNNLLDECFNMLNNGSAFNQDNGLSNEAMSLKNKVNQVWIDFNSDVAKTLI